MSRHAVGIARGSQRRHDTVASNCSSSQNGQLEPLRQKYGLYDTTQILRRISFLVNSSEPRCCQLLLAIDLVEPTALSKEILNDLLPIPDELPQSMAAASSLLDIGLR
eukprot:6195774-Pleurochrysis_carterae.AAC.3